MKYIKGKIRSFIYESSTGYRVGVFRVKETNDEEVNDFLNKSLTFTGHFADVNHEDTYTLYGQYIYNDKYGYQYRVDSYERAEIKGQEAVIEFLSSSLIKGCGEKTAFKIVEILGEEAIEKIKENYQNLLLVPGINEAKAIKIYESLQQHQNTDATIVQLKKIGFSIREALDILNTFQDKTLKLIEDNIYQFTSIIDFNKVDRVYLTFGQNDSTIRLKACLIESLKRECFTTGDTYLTVSELSRALQKEFQIYLEEEELLGYINQLEGENELVCHSEKIYLSDMDNYEQNISRQLNIINTLNKTPLKNYEKIIRNFEDNSKIIYNREQKAAIKNALENRITIITGGPGTGKTTIVKAIVQLYIEINNLRGSDIIKEIALISPTGRASKKLAESTNMPAMTIHRYLKWNKEKNDFQINSNNKNEHKLIVIDEVSMIDTFLFSSLLSGLNSDIKLILVGDPNQLPSVGPGLILADIIAAEQFKYCPLSKIYRQSGNSYIPILAKEIREQALSNNFIDQKDDYNFLEVNSVNIKESIKKICQISASKNLTEKDIQILAPMYKGMNGIDNLNIALQELFNPPSNKKNESKIGDVIYRVGDKVLQLINDPDNNVFNGDIGYLARINKKDQIIKKDTYTIDFEGNLIEYEREDMNSVKHAYAISIHKSQGSEFPHIIMPICSEYHKMLYNKLIYTGVSRAKKSLVIIGNPQSFILATKNNYSNNRKTTLKERIISNHL